MTTTIDRPNKRALTDAIDIYRDAMRPFLIRHLKQIRVRGFNLESAIYRSLRPDRANYIKREVSNGKDIADMIDVGDFPELIQRNWPTIFKDAFSEDKTIRNEPWLISDARNKASHPGQQDLDTAFASVHLYHIASVLGKINAPQERQMVLDIHSQLANQVSSVVAPETTAEMEISASSETAQPAPTRARASANFKPWREVIPPNQDVALGSYQQAEFAASLQQVYDGRASSAYYGNPVSFFNSTYITPGMRSLLVNTVKRLNGSGGDPVIHTRTGFGGGKTHSLIALYHLVNNADALINPAPGSDSRAANEIREILEEAGYGDQSAAAMGQVAVLDGTHLSPSDQETTPDGDPLNTLWGVLAWQLGGQKAYDIIGESARRGIAPGQDQLNRLLDNVGPCLILIDELVAYWRNASTVIGVDSDSVHTFLQALTASVTASKDAALVVTLIESHNEAGGERGVQALAALEHLFGRIEAVWEPLAVSEAFEVVRRRLFNDLADPAARDQTCEAFANMYSRSRAEYPQGVAEQNYRERMKACYPIHPEIFDRLYNDWSTIPSFQRTRGVLRMMAQCVSRLYLNNDPSPLIMPANLPFSDEQLANEFNRLLPGEWGPVLSEVDTDNSRTDNIDRESTRFSEVGGAARRIARTIFLGSATSGATRGVDARQIHLGVVQLGQGSPRYNEALQRMTGNLYYLYQENGRYYFHAEENLNKVAGDRFSARTDKEADAHILSRLEEARNRRSEVLLYANDPTGTAGVPDVDFVRLVTLPPDLSLPSRSAEEDTATPAAAKILQQRGDAPRIHRNTLLFLTARRDEIRNLRHAVQRFLAWDSIINGDARIDNLTGSRLAQARTELAKADEEVKAALLSAYRWTLSPVQLDPNSAEYKFSQAQTDNTNIGEIFHSAFERFVADEALVERITPASLTSMLEQYVWNREGSGEHMSVNRLWNTLTSQVYLHRLKDRTVLVRCIEEGVAQGSFGYADGYDGAAYRGLRYGEPRPGSGTVLENRSDGILVHPNVAARQKENEAAATSPTPGGRSSDTAAIVVPDAAQGTALPPVRRTRSITARKRWEGQFSLDDINLLREEIIRNLSGDGGEITVEIIVSARNPEGFSENIARSVWENSRQLGLDFNEDIE